MHPFIAVLIRPATGFIRGYARFMTPENSWKNFLFLFLGVAAGWWIYVPAHELLHVAGCFIGGGEVSRLEIQPIYGGRILARVFSFVAAESNYAGRLSGFDTHGSDWAYGLLVYFPFLLTPFGFAGLETGTRGKKAFVFGLFLPVVLAPIISLTGDFFELGSLLLFQFWPGSSDAHKALISDDLLLLVRQMGSPSVPSGLFAGGFVALSLLLGTAMAWGTLMLSQALGGAVFKSAPAPRD
jgi:hypothetical protein